MFLLSIAFVPRRRHILLVAGRLHIRPAAGNNNYELQAPSPLLFLTPPPPSQSNPNPPLFIPATISQCCVAFRPFLCSVRGCECWGDRLLFRYSRRICLRQVSHLRPFFVFAFLLHIFLRDAKFYQLRAIATYTPRIVLLKQSPDATNCFTRDTGVCLV